MATSILRDGVHDPVVKKLLWELPGCYGGKLNILELSGWRDYYEDQLKHCLVLKYNISSFVAN